MLVSLERRAGSTVNNLWRCVAKCAARGFQEGSLQHVRHVLCARRSLSGPPSRPMGAAKLLSGDKGSASGRYGYFLSLWGPMLVSLERRAGSTVNNLWRCVAKCAARGFQEGSLQHDYCLVPALHTSDDLGFMSFHVLLVKTAKTKMTKTVCKKSGMAGMAKQVAKLPMINDQIYHQVRSLRSPCKCWFLPELPRLIQPRRRCGSARPTSFAWSSSGTTEVSMWMRHLRPKWLLSCVHLRAL